MADRGWRSGIPGFRNPRRLRQGEQAPDAEGAERFRRKRVTSPKKATPGPTVYDNREQSFQPEEEGAIDALERIINAHDTGSRPETQVHNCSWDRVFDLMSEARASHKPSIYGNPYLGIGGDLLSQYIDLIPEEYGLGLLKGGLALIFEALQKKDENAQKILDVFETIPETLLTINTAYTLLDPEPDDEQIKREFYDTLVKDVPVLISILRGSEPWYKKVVQFLALRIPETLNIDEIIGRWSSTTSLLKGRVERMNIRILGSLKSRVDGAENIATQAQTAEISIRTLLSTNSSLQQALMGKLQGHITEKYLELRHQNRLTACAITGLDDEIRRLSSQIAESGRTYERPQRRRHVSLVTPIQLLGIVNISNHTSWGDLDIVLRQARLFDPEIQGRAGWLIKTDGFRDWLQAERSSLLLADGCLSEHNGLITPMSGFCATLISGLAESRQNIVLFFFAGQHCDMQCPKSDGNGPKGLVRSLISQLLLYSDMAEPDLDFLSREYLEDLGRYHMEALCDLFDNLVQQLPPGSQVYCIIDGMSWYEQSMWLDDLEYVAAMFEHLAKVRRRSPRKSASVKLLMTSPGKSTELVKRSWDRGSVWGHVSLAAGQAITGVPRIGA